MGQKTYKTMPEYLLKDRLAIVLSKEMNFKATNAITFHCLRECLAYIDKQNYKNKFYMIGGGQIATLFLKYNLISYFILTEIQKSYIGDTFMPLHYFKNWKKQIIKNTKDYIIYLLTNQKKNKYN